MAVLNGDETTYEPPSGEIEIMADDGRSLFSIRQEADGSIEVRTGSVCKQGGVILDTGILIRPHVSNSVQIFREPYRP